MKPDSTDLNRPGTVYRRLLGYVRPYWQGFVVSLGGMVVFAATDTGFAALMKPMVDGSFIEKDPRIIRIVPLLLIGLFILRGVTGFFANYGMQWVGRRVIKDLRGEMFRHILRLPSSFYDVTASGKLISKFTFDVEQVAVAATNALTILVRDSLTVIGLLAWMFYLNWMLTLVFLVIGPLIAWLIGYINRRFRRISTDIQGSMGDVTHVVEEAIEGQQVIKTFSAEQGEAARFEAANEENRHQHMKMVATSAASVPIVQLIAAFALAGVIVLATLDPMLEKITAGTFMSFIVAMMMLLPPMKRLTTVNASVQRGIAAGQSIFGLLVIPAEVDEGADRLAQAQGRIQYQGVSLTYAADKGPVLDGIDLDIAPGETVAIVGRSGSGKTSLVNLLPRFYEMSAGRILLDGRDIREIRRGDLRKQFALVGQSVVLFNDTIANNIAFGALAGASPGEIEEAAAAAHAMEFIERLPQGLDTMIGEKGVLLSGGQRQRIAIARALLKDAPILILDEATSALDTESERHIQAALDRLMRDRTTLVIAHRLSTIKKADKVVVLEAGKIVESGSHADLLAQGGHYATLYRLQFSELLEDDADPLLARKHTG